jgi:shikimate kinase
MAERILLIGMMGVGKSSVGEALAARLGWPYFDSDRQVEEATGRTVPEIFAADGEAAFRREESAALEAAIATSPSIVGVAGGAVLDVANRERIRDAGLVVWLRASIDTIVRRVGVGEGRPLLGDDPDEALRRLYPERRPLYEELAEVVVDVDELTIEQSVDTIVAALA